MPGHDVGVVFHNRQDDFIARLHAGGRPTVGYKIDRLRCARGKNNMLIRRRIQKPRNGGSGGFILVCCKVRKVVQATVNIGIFMTIGGSYRVYHHLRLLRGCAIIKVNQRFAVHLPRQNRELAANFGNIIHRSSPDPNQHCQHNRNRNCYH